MRFVLRVNEDNLLTAMLRDQLKSDFLIGQSIHRGGNARLSLVLLKWRLVVMGTAETRDVARNIIWKL